MLATFADRAIGADVVAALDERPAEVVVVDCLLFSVMDALRTAGRSYVALEHSFDTCWRRMAKGPFGMLLRLRGFKALELIDGGEPTWPPPSPTWTPADGDVIHTGAVVCGIPPRSVAADRAAQPEHVRVPRLEPPGSGSSTPWHRSKPG